VNYTGEKKAGVPPAGLAPHMHPIPRKYDSM